MKKITKEECIEVAKLFTNKTDFHNKKRKYFDFAKENGIMKEATAHMENKYCKSKYTKEDVIKIAKRYTKLLDFKREQSFFFHWAKNHKCQDEIFSHMEKCGSRYKRCIYAYEFPNKVCYVGLTFNLKMRDINHRSSLNSQVYKYSMENGIDIPEPIMLTGYIDRTEASEKETFFYEKYKNEGWHMLNKAKTGALGGNNEDDIKYSKEACISYAKKFNSRKEVEINNRYLYNKILSHGWADEAFSHLDKAKIEKERRKKISKSKIGKKSTVPFERASEFHSIRKVVQLDKTGSVINEFNNPNEAARKVFNDLNKNTSIRNCCNGKIKTFGGFIWKYK